MYTHFFYLSACLDLNQAKIFIRNLESTRPTGGNSTTILEICRANSENRTHEIHHGKVMHYHYAMFANMRSRIRTYKGFVTRRGLLMTRLVTNRFVLRRKERESNPQGLLTSAVFKTVFVTSRFVLPNTQLILIFYFFFLYELIDVYDNN